MDNTSGKESQNLSKQDTEKTLTNLIVITIVAVVLAIAGTGFGIYSTIQVNRTMKFLEESLGADLSSVDGEDTIADVYGKPNSPEDIAEVYLVYNNGNDYVNIYSSNEVEYYTYDDDDEYVGDTIESDTSEIIKYVFDNDLEYLGDIEPTGEETWSLQVVTKNDEYSIVSGSSDAPDWFNELLNKLDVKANGYKSNSLSSERVES